MPKTLGRNGIVGGVIVAAWLLLNAGRGLSAYFSPDDIMNMYWAWTEPWQRLVVANLIPFASDSYRPLGALVYRTNLWLFGLNPIPLRILIYALLLSNAWLVYRLAKRLTGSSEIGFLAAFFMAFHHRLLDVYTNTGTIYDILCCTFYLLTLLFYMRVRERGRFRALDYVVLYALVVATLNSKEIGATLPVILLGYEVLYRRPRWPFADTAPAWMAALVTALAVWRKMDAGSHFVGNTYYAVHLSWHQYFLTTRAFLNDLFLLPDNTLNSRAAAAVLLSVIAIAAVARRKHIWFCVLLILIGPLPVNFIVPRGLFAIYVPMIGWAIFTAAVLVEGRDWLYTRLWKRPPLTPSPWEPERVFLFAAIVTLLVNLQAHDRPIDWTFADWSKNSIYQLTDGLQRLNLKISGKSSILFLDDKFTRDDWIPVLLVRMMYRDPELRVERAKTMDHRPEGTLLAGYSYMLNYEGDRLLQVEPAPNRVAKP